MTLMDNPSLKRHWTTCDIVFDIEDVDIGDPGTDHGARGCGHTAGVTRPGQRNNQRHEETQNNRRRGSVRDETGAGHHQVNTDHHDTLRVEQMFELTQNSIKDNYSAIHEFTT